MRISSSSRNLRTSGYTLIELLVVVALLMGMTTTLAINSRASRNSANADAAALQVVAAVQYAVALGRSGTQTGSADYDRGHGVYFETGATSIRMYKGRGDGTDPDDELYLAANTIENQALPRGVSISSVCAKNLPGSCSGGGGTKVHVHARRGESEVNIRKDAGAGAINRAEIVVSIGSEQRTILIYNTGLAYVQ